MSTGKNIVVSGAITLAEGALDHVREAIVTMQDASRAEDGCQDYTFSIDLGDPAVLRIAERWDDIAALKRHFTMPHMAVFQKALAAHPPIASDVSFFEVDEIPRPAI